MSKMPQNTTSIITSILCLVNIALFAQVSPQRHEHINADREAYVDISHSIGLPLGGIGTGYSVFGKYGFAYPHLDGYPEPEGYNASEDGKDMYYRVPDSEKANYGFILEADGEQYVLQETAATWAPEAKVIDHISSKALLPLGIFDFETKDTQFSLSLEAYSPLIAHDLETSSIPVQIYDFIISNNSEEPRTYTLKFVKPEGFEKNQNLAIYNSASGNMTCAFDDGFISKDGASVRVSLPPSSEQEIRFVLAWYYPDVSGNANIDEVPQQKRYYTKRFKHSTEIANLALEQASSWKQRIKAWHNNYDVPGTFKRLWFSSFSSIITSTILTQDYFYEIESPHPCISTMDVNVYSNWVYMINWPEIEKMEMRQFFSTIPTEGKHTGRVLHDLWIGSAKYVEEPTFLARYYRDYLWYNDKDFAEEGYPLAIVAANRVFHKKGEGNYKHLISSKHGNQSYDLWKMPGVSAYVNNAWLYGLYGLEQTAKSLNKKEPKINNTPISKFLSAAIDDYNETLWDNDHKYWLAYYLSEGVKDGKQPTAVFTDQLFGQWVVAIDPKSTTSVLDQEMQKQALNTIYSTNMIEDKSINFRGWSNGMMPDGTAVTNDGQITRHARTCWMGAQLNMGSVYGLLGEEHKSLDVFYTLEQSLNNDHLAVGEWNKVITTEDKVACSTEIAKDTPRFPAYPRYKSSWEYLIRILGLQVDTKYMYLNPFTSLDFNLKDIKLANMNLSIEVNKGWNQIIINGKTAKNNNILKIKRSNKPQNIQFLKRSMQTENQ